MTLEVELSGLKFKNPIIIGSAGYCGDKNGLKRFIKRGWGGVVTKSTSKERLVGSPPPRVFWYDPYKKTCLDGAEAHRNQGIKKMAEAVKACKDLADKENCHIIGSLSCASVEEAVYNASEFEKAGVSAVELDIQCPQTGEHLGMEYANRGSDYWSDPKNPGRTAEVIKAVKDAVDVPVWPKILPRTIYLVGDVIETKSSPDAFSFVGYKLAFSQPGLAIDIETDRPIFNGNTLLKIRKKMKFFPSVPQPLFQTTVFATAVLKRKIGVPLVPSGGITRGFDVVQAMMAGASAVEVCTAAYRDMDVIENMLREISWFMSKKGITNLSEVVGIALKHIPFDLMEIPVPS